MKERPVLSAKQKQLQFEETLCPLDSTSRTMSVALNSFAVLRGRMGREDRYRWVVMQSKQGVIAKMRMFECVCVYAAAKVGNGTQLSRTWKAKWTQQQQKKQRRYSSQLLLLRFTTLLIMSLLCHPALFPSFTPLPHVHHYHRPKKKLLWRAVTPRLLHE
jgi:hypothetical protein